MNDAVLWFALGAAAGATAAGAAASLLARRALRHILRESRKARAAERQGEIGAMTGGLAHEIKNPLSTIGLNAQLLAEGIEELEIDPEEKGKLSRRVGSLRREADRLRGILTDFLEFAGALKLDRQPTDVNEAVGELADFFMPQAQGQGVRMRLDLAPGPLVATVDAAAVKQALLNLMLNAVQAMNASPLKELIIKTQRATDPEGRPSVVLHVIDTGPGIPPDALPRIFDPYFTTKPGGTGLGLPMTRRLMEAHGGRIDVHTAPNTGTDFVVSLPLEAAPEPPRELTAGAANHGRSPDPS